MLAQSHHDLAADINVAPMIDVLLVLLVIFMLIQQVRLTMPLNVPPPDAQAGAAGEEPIVLSLQRDGTFSLNGLVVDREGLAGRIRSAFQNRAMKILYVRGGEGVRYGAVIDAADIARGAGISVIGYVPPPGPSTR
jgi:biopolymer transport protein ExbD